MTITQTGIIITPIISLNHTLSFPLSSVLIDLTYFEKGANGDSVSKRPPFHRWLRVNNNGVANSESHLSKKVLDFE